MGSGHIVRVELDGEVIAGVGEADFFDHLFEEEIVVGNESGF